MIKAVFFDLYNTLAGFSPAREVVQAQAGRELGLELDKAGIIRGYVEADELMTAQNARKHVARLTPEEQRAFFARYEQLVLRGAGVQASEELASRVWERVRQIPYGLAAYDDAVPCLISMKERGLTTGVISNVDGDLDQMCRTLGLAEWVDFTMSSRKAGAEKPKPRIFQMALAEAEVQPHEAMHVGDQYNGDIVGARGVGILPILLDREWLLHHYTDVRRIRSLDEVPDLLEDSGPGIRP